MADVNRQIWDNAWKLAEQKGWSKAEFARKLKSRPQTLNNYEAGLREVGKVMRKRMADVLGVPEADLLQSAPVQTALPAAPLNDYTDYTRLLEKLVEAQGKRIDDLSTQLQGAIDRIDRRHLEAMARIDDRLDKQATNLHQRETRLIELDHQLGETQHGLQQVTAALGEVEKTRDLKYLRQLAGRGK